MIAFSGIIHRGMCILLWILWYFQTGVWVNPIIMVFATMLPDADHPKTFIGTFIPLHWFFKHRGFTHSWYGLITFTLPVACYNWRWGIAFGIGYLIHLGLDDMTYTGVDWWMTKKRKKFN